MELAQKFCDEEKEKMVFFILFSKQPYQQLLFQTDQNRSLKKSEEGTDSGRKKKSSPGKKRPGAPLAVDDNTDQCIIRRKIHDFYALQEDVPTLNKILAGARESIDFQWNKETPCTVIGFWFKKCSNIRSDMIERNDIVAWRAWYLIKKYCEEGRNIVYLDEL